MPRNSGGSDGDGGARGRGDARAAEQSRSPPGSPPGVHVQSTQPPAAWRGRDSCRGVGVAGGGAGISFPGSVAGG